MNRWTVLICGWLLAAPTGQAIAQGSSNPSIGVVNIAQVFEGYQMTRDLEARFDAKRRGIADEAENRRKAMENQMAALEAFDPTSKDYADRQEKVQRMEFEFRVWLEMEEQKLKREHMLWLRMIYNDVSRAVAQSAQSRGIDLVMTYEELSPDVPDSTALRQEILLKKVVYFSDRVDLTGQVLRQVNESYEGRGGAASLQKMPAKPIRVAPTSAN